MDTNMLSALEKLWAEMVQRIEKLKNEKAKLTEELQAKAAQIQEMTAKITDLGEQLHLEQEINRESQQEKEHILQRIDLLLSKLPDLE